MSNSDYSEREWQTQWTRRVILTLAEQRGLSVATVAEGMVADWFTLPGAA